MWDYLKYIVHLHEKDANDYNGLEDYVFSCLENNKIDWFPVGRASCLAESDDAENDLKSVQKEVGEAASQIGHLSESLLDMRKKLEVRMERVTTLRKEVAGVHERLSQRVSTV